MKLIILMFFLVSCVSENRVTYQKGDCVKFEVPHFYAKVCENAIFRVGNQGFGKYHYIVSTYYLNVRKGCPSIFAMTSDTVSRKIECPEDF